MLGVDSGFFQARSQKLAERIVADAANKPDISPQPADRYRLIRPFSSWEARKTAAEDRFSRPWEPLSAEYKVIICAADNPNVSSH